tara:strand:+ start:2275 stop:2739 length:465 start_codon:yes stop_codon:yes gene_type:complete
MDAATARKHSTRRRAIVGAIADKLYENLNGSPPFRSAVQSVEPRLRFWDEVNDFPAIQVGAGQETREYEGAGFRFRFLRVTIRCYVNDSEDVILALEELLEDVETVIEDNDPLTYTDSTGTSQTTAKSTILSVDTDEGVLEPLGVGEVIIEVQY